MCGIVAYTGKKKACPILINGIKKLEYRGYDSAGLAVIKNDITVYKSKGKVADLEAILPKEGMTETCGIAHTRWATHGEPNTENAHPHYSFSQQMVLVHNGIIENYLSLKEKLIKTRYTFRSDTDTEVLISYIEYIQKSKNVLLVEAVRLTLKNVYGAYAIVILSKENPQQIIAARRGSPLAIGIGKNFKEYIVASDAIPIIAYTKDLIYLNDNEIAVIEPQKKVRVINLENRIQKPKIQYVNLDIASTYKGDYEFYMRKEIFEQTETIYNTVIGRLDQPDGRIHLEGIDHIKDKFLSAKRIIIVACGTSWHAGLTAEYIIEELVRIPVEVEYASEFRYRNPILRKNDVVLAISQSGETADTLAAIRYAHKKGITVLTICNVFNSTMARESDAVLYTYAGMEIGVASTKAFTAQIALLLVFALYMSVNKKTIHNKKADMLINGLKSIPSYCRQILSLDPDIAQIASQYLTAHSFLYLGRGIHFPIALEGALKLKEISYIHAEGYPAAEMKHGPIAMIDENLPVLLIATNTRNYEKIVSNAQEVKARKGRIIAIVNKGDETMKKLANHIISIPKTDDLLQPLLVIIPLHLLSYHIAVMKGCNVDQPRNLAKSVTVE